MGKFISSLQHGLSIISFGRIQVSPDASKEEQDDSSKQSAPSKTRATEEETETELSSGFFQRIIAKTTGIFKRNANNNPEINAQTSNDVTPAVDIPTLSHAVRTPPTPESLASTMVVSKPSAPVEYEEPEEMADMADMSELFGTTAVAETPDISALLENEENNNISDLFETANVKTDLSELLEAEETAKSSSPPKTVDIEATIPTSPKKPKDNVENSEPESDSEPNQNESIFKRLIGTITQFSSFNKKTEPADSEVNPEPDEKTSFIKQFVGKITQFAKLGGAKIETVDSATDSKTASETDSEFDETASPDKLSFRKKKMIVIGLIIFIIMVATTIAAFVFWPSTKQHDQKAMTPQEKNHKTPKAGEAETLESRNKKLEEEYKKLKEKNAALLEENKKLQNQTDPASDDSPASLSSSKTKSNGKTGNGIDCAITSKESAGKTLKDCIDAYNATNK